MWTSSVTPVPIMISRTCFRLRELRRSWALMMSCITSMSAKAKAMSLGCRTGRDSTRRTHQRHLLLRAWRCLCELSREIHRNATNSRQTAGRSSEGSWPRTKAPPSACPNKTSFDLSIPYWPHLADLETCQKTMQHFIKSVKSVFKVLHFLTIADYSHFISHNGNKK